MKKELIVPLVILLLVAIIIGYFALEGSVDNSIKVGSAKFNMPNNYHIDENQTSDKNIAITNGSNVIFLSHSEGKYATPYIDSYINYTTESGRIVTSNSTLKINDLLVYRFENNKGANHDWFVYNNEVYEIYSWENTPNFDGIAFELINSIN